MEAANIVVIGAGVVGLSVAAHISENNEGVYIFEKHSRIGQESSSRNSGVIHSGIHYKKGSLKAALCVKGNAMIYDICRKYGIPHKRLGKLTVGIGEDEIKTVERLLAQGVDNGVEDLELFDSSNVTKLEPKVNADIALHSPSSGIIEPDELMTYYYALANKHGATLATDTEVTGIKKVREGFEISGTSSRQKFNIHANTIINCAGLSADKMASIIGLDIDRLGYRIRYCKGDYFRVSGEPPVRMLVYPVPKGAGLGIHLTPDMSGSVKLGPNAYFVDKIDYKVETDVKEFREDVRRYLPSISNRDIQIDSSGIRPQIFGAENTFKDFVIRHEADRDLQGFINLIGIESPGLTASPAIGEYICELYENEIRD